MPGRRATFSLTNPGPLRLYSTTELLRMPAPEWLIESIMPVGGLVGLYGAPATCKSFLAIDMALSIASGCLWQGFGTGAGLVLYVAAEGSTGLTQRVVAWLKHKAVRPSKTNIAWLTIGIPVNADSTDMTTLMNRITDELPEPPLLVVIDTLARCFDGDENQQQDMGRFIGGVDLLRREYGSTVMVVHHTRLDGDRERGNTAFRGAADTMIAVSRKGTNGPITIVCNKQKDAEEFDPLRFVLAGVPGTNSCVIAPDTRTAKKQEKVGEILHVLRTQGPLTWDAWFGLVHSEGIGKTTFYNNFTELKEMGKIIKENGQWRVSNPD